MIIYCRNWSLGHWLDCWIIHSFYHAKMSILAPIRTPYVLELSKFNAVFLSPPIAENGVTNRLPLWLLLSRFNSISNICRLVNPLRIEHEVITWLKAHSNRSIFHYLFHHVSLTRLTIGAPNIVIVTNWIGFIQLANITFFTSSCCNLFISITPIRY